MISFARPRWQSPSWLPRGGTLPPEAWAARHQAVLVLLGVHLVGIPVYALVRGYGLGHALFEITPIALATFFASRKELGRTVQASVAAVGLMLCSGVIVHLSDGLVEAHFHFFVMIPVVALYEAWLPFVMGVAYVLVHHGLMGTWDPRSVYNQPAAWDRPWLFAGIHAAFFASACVACVVNWWLHERARGVETELVATLEHRAGHDSLTGLPNRAAFLGAGDGLRAGASTSVLMLDLDRFKEVNDTLGHTSGDHLLAQVSERLSGVLRPGQLLARLGGDEFALLLPGTTAEEAVEVALVLRGALQENFVVDGMLLDVDASVGVATHTPSAPLGTDGGCDVAVLLRHADVAMYKAKNDRTGVAEYDADADDNTRERLTLLADLRRGLENDELVLHYQPKVSLTDNALTGIEALVRWQHPERGLLPPALFIPAAEHTALIGPLTRHVVELALGQTATWLAAGSAVPVAVNVSPRCLLEDDFPAFVLDALGRHEVPAAHLRLEITESTLVLDPERARAVLQVLSDAGVRLSIDDFGTGYSSMSYLRHLPIDELKVDRSFVAGMCERREDAVLVQSAIDLGHNLGLTVVAEGVETDAVVSALTGSGCDIAQGYLFSRPVPADELSAWLAPGGAPVAPTRPALVPVPDVDPRDVDPLVEEQPA